MKKQILLLLGIVWNCIAFCQQADSIQKVIPGRTNSIAQQKKPYVIMISVDALRYDYIQKYQAKNLIALSKSGVQATSMIPSYPSITFPNHYTLVTGLYPSHTGIVCNKFYDRKFNAIYSSKTASALDARWYGGTPLWVLAEKQQMLSAVFYWVGSDSPIQGTYPTYRYSYSEKISIGNRINTVINWLKLPEANRPHLINMYFPQVDHAGHHFGPESDQTKRAVLLIDLVVNALHIAVKKTGLKVNFVFVSDHGMSHVDDAHPLKIPALIDTTRFLVTGEDMMVELYTKDKWAVKSTYQKLLHDGKDKYKAYLSTNTPAHWNFNKANDRYNRISDILLITNPPYVFVYNNKSNVNPGAHGYDPKLVKDMQATFRAWGPAFKNNLTIPPFKNVDVYPLVAQILGLKIIEPIDGRISLAKKILRTKKPAPGK